MRHQLIIILLLFTASVYAQEVRTGFEYEHRLKKILETELKYDKRFYNSGKLMNFSNVFQGACGVELLSQINIGGAIRYSVYDKETNEELMIKKYNDKFRYTFDLGYKFRKTGDYQHKLRLRYQHSYFGNQKRNDYLRVKYYFQYKVSDFCKFKGCPEVFYRLDKDRLNSARFSFITEIEVNKISFELFYTIERDWKMRDFEYYNIIGLTMKYTRN